MTGVRWFRSNPLAIVAMGSVAAFAIFAGFESHIAAISAKMEDLAAKVAYDESLLRTPGPSLGLVAAIDARLEDLRLTARAEPPGIVLFEEVARTAKAHGVRLSGLRGNPALAPRAGVKAGAFDEFPFEVVFEGRYANAIHAIGDLARAHLILRDDGITIERIRRSGDSSEGVRATLALRIIRFAKGKPPANVLSHPP